MCGITGFTGQGCKADISKMTDALRHRGPDAGDLFHDKTNRLFFGHRRLSIIDIHDGSQPMSTSDGNLIVIFNGEIYNHTELRIELEQNGHKFLSDHSDTEVLLHGYREWGDKLPEKLNGMWAFALYDKQNNLVFISRDRFGKKPLFYSIQDNTFVFSSELSSLILHPSIKTSISKKNLQKYFAYGYIPSPSSIYKNIYKLPGGHNLTYRISSNRLEVKKYWEFILEPFETLPPNPEEDWGEELRFLISKAVKRRLVSDVPLGIFLSGGIDSSCIAATAASFLEPGALKTFSINFDDKSFDESEYSQMAAAFIKTDHHNETLSLEKSKKLLPEIISMLDEPMGDSSLLPTWLLSQATRKHVTVALGGDGADELFAGYDPFQALKYAEIYSKLIPKPIHRGIQSIIGLLPVSHKNMSLDFKLKRTLKGLSYDKKIWSPVWLGSLSPSEIEELFNEPVDIEDLYSEAIELWDSCNGMNLIDQTLQFYSRFYLQEDILVKVDRASMMNSLEVRAPFLDIELVDFARKIPSEYKYRNGQTKYILKKALEKILPREILYRPKKGFGIPVGKWLKQSFFNFDKKIFPDMLNPTFLDKTKKNHFTNKADNRAFLWNYWLLKTWGLKS